MPACDRCGKAYKTPATLARHQVREGQCMPKTKGKKAKAAGGAAGGAATDAVAGPAEAGPAEAGPAAALDVGRAMWRARDILRKSGVTGLDALDCVATLVVWRELGRLFPTMADRAAYDADAFDTDELRDAHARGCFTLEQYCASGEPQRDTVRRALTCLRAGPAAVAVGDLFDDVARLYPLADHATSQELARYIAGEFRGADILGDAFTSVVRDLLGGKELGQYFTPPAIVELAVREAADGRPLGEVLDPTCGSGGFLTAALRAGATDVGGLELDRRVALLARAAVMLADGRPHTGVAAGNFLRDHVAPPYDPARPGRRQFDTVLANPPYGLAALDVAELRAALGDEGGAAYPLESTATGLFVQRIVREAKVGGRVCIVLPLGCELESCAASHVAFRRSLMAALVIRKVIAIPRKTFANTEIPTALLVADKRRDMAAEPGAVEPGPVTFGRYGSPDTVSVAVERIAENDWILRPADYLRSDGNPAARVRVDSVCDVVDTAEGATLLVAAAPPYLRARGPAAHPPFVAHMIRAAPSEMAAAISAGRVGELLVPAPPLERQVRVAADLAEVAPADLVDAPAEARHRAERARRDAGRYLRLAVHGVGAPGPHQVRRHIGEICRLRQGRSIKKDKLVPGPYAAVGGGIKPIGTHSTPNRPPGSLTISLTGTVGHVAYHADPIYCGSDAATIECDGIRVRYLYYVLASMSAELREMATGLAQPHFDKRAFGRLSVVVPPEDVQDAIVDRLDEYAAAAKRYYALARRLDSYVAEYAPWADYLPWLA